MSCIDNSKKILKMEYNIYMPKKEKIKTKLKKLTEADKKVKKPVRSRKKKIEPKKNSGLFEKNEYLHIFLFILCS